MLFFSACSDKICYTVLLIHLRLMCHPSMCTDKWHPTASTLCSVPLSLPSRKALEESYAQNKARRDHPRNFLTILVAISDSTSLHYGTRLAEGERERERWTVLIFLPFLVCHFLLHIVITTADWGRLYKLLYVLFDASICSPAMILLCKCKHINSGHYLVFGPSLHMGYAIMWEK